MLPRHPGRNLQSYVASWKERNCRLAAGPSATVEGITLNVAPGVFSPDPSLTKSSSLLIQSLPEMKGKSLLDMGSGCGIVAIHAALKGARAVTGADIQPEAVANTRDNAAAFGLEKQIQSLVSDVFENVSGTYDVIAANLPFMVKSYALNDIATETYRRFFAELNTRLCTKGTALLTFGSWGDLDTLEKLIAESGLTSRRYSETHKDVTWYIFELALPNHRHKKTSSAHQARLLGTATTKAK